MKSRQDFQADRVETRYPVVSSNSLKKSPARYATTDIRIFVPSNKQEKT